MIHSSGVMSAQTVSECWSFIFSFQWLINRHPLIVSFPASSMHFLVCFLVWQLRRPGKHQAAPSFAQEPYSWRGQSVEAWIAGADRAADAWARVDDGVCENILRPDR